jgi:hypothetical protein
MKNSYRSTFILQGFVLICALLNLAQAQFFDMNLAYNEFAQNQQVNAQLEGMFMTGLAQQQQLLQSVGNDPQVQAAYNQYVQSTGQQLPYEQFVYYYTLTAGGTDLQNGLNVINAIGAGARYNAQTMNEASDIIMNSWEESGAIMDQTMTKYSDIAINGNAYYTDPYSGQTYTLPYTSGAGYYQVGQDYFYVDPTGQYWRQDGNFWTPLDPYNP